MKISYRMTAYDYGEALRADAWSKAWSRWNHRISLVLTVLTLAGCMMLAMLVPAFIMLAIDRETRPVVWVGMLFFSLCVTVLALRSMLRSVQWRWQDEKIDALEREFSSEISEDGIVSSSEAGCSETKWIAFIRWCESENLFLLYRQPRLFYIYPKRAFAPGEMGEFRELLQRKIPAK